MADEKRIATLEWLHNNLYEFKKTEELRNSKKGSTKSELISLYNVDESLLTSYTDKQLIPQGKCVGIPLSVDCSEAISTTGTSGIYETMFDLGTEEGTIFVDTSSHNIPDRFIVYSPSGEVLADSLFYGETPSEISTGTYTLPIKKYNSVSKTFIETDTEQTFVVGDSDIDKTVGVGTKTISFFKRKTTSSYIVKLRVIGVKQNTGWDVKIQCPSDTHLGAHALQGVFVNINPTNLKYELSSKDEEEKTTYYEINDVGSKTEIGKSFVGVFNESEAVFPNVPYITNLSVMHNGNKFFKEGLTLKYSDRDFTTLNTFNNTQNLFVSPDKKLAMMSGNNKKFSNGIFTDMSYEPKGFLFGNGRLLSTLSSKVNYPPTTYQNTTYTNLISTDEILVLENTGDKVKVFKWRKDFSDIPTNIYNGFIDDVNKNSISLRNLFRPGHTSRGFFKEVSLNLVGKKVVMDVATQSDVINLIDGIDDGTKTFIRFGTGDFVNNYFEYETPFENILDASTRNGVWRRNINILTSIMQSAKDQRDLDGFSDLQRFNYAFDENNPNITCYVKGQPSLSNITHFYIGFRNTSGPSDKDCILWVKDVEVRGESNNVKESDIDIRRSEVEMYNKNIYPYIISNEEGYEIISSIKNGTDYDELKEIGFSQKLIHETTIEGVTKAELRTEESLIPHGAISTNIGIFNTSDLLNKISSDVNLITSVINKQGANLMIFNQNDNSVIDRNINGEVKKTIGFYFNSKFIDLAYDFNLGVTNKSCIDTDGTYFYVGGDEIIKTDASFNVLNKFPHECKDLYCFNNGNVLLIGEDGVVKMMSPNGTILNTYFDNTKEIVRYSISRNKEKFIICRAVKGYTYDAFYNIITQDGTNNTVLSNVRHGSKVLYIFDNGNIILSGVTIDGSSTGIERGLTIVSGGGAIIKHINVTELSLTLEDYIGDVHTTTDLDSDIPTLYIDTYNYQNTEPKNISVKVDKDGNVSSIVNLGAEKPKAFKTTKGSTNKLFLQGNNLKYNNNIDTQIKINNFSNALQIGNNFYIIDDTVESEYDVKSIHKQNGEAYSYLGMCKSDF